MKILGKFVVDVFKHAVVVYDGMPEYAKKNAQARCEFAPDSQQIDIYVKGKDAFTGYVMHECVHAADFILNNIGADMGTSPSDSAIRAYLAEYIYCQTECILGRMKATSLFRAIDPEAQKTNPKKKKQSK